MKKLITLFSVCLFLLHISCSEDTIDVVLMGNLSGKVTDKLTGVPLENVKITTNPASTTVFTDSIGRFRINNIPVDDYSVQAELSGYAAGFEATAVTEGQTAAVSFELSLANSDNNPPTIPILISPEDGAVDLPLEVQFIWEASDPEDDELSYTLDLRNGSTDEVQVFEVGQDTTFTVSNLQLATKYFWQVTVTDETNDPVSSLISEFKTLTLPDNPYIFVKEKNGSLVIFSGAQDTVTGGNTTPDFNVLQLTSDNTNSFRPRKSNILKRIAFLRNSGGNTNIFTMNYDGTDVRQITSQRPLAGFRTEELDFTWAKNDSKLYYPYFDKLYSVNSDGSGFMLEYTTSDGAFISEVAVPEFDDNLVLLKTNNPSGYDVRIYTARIDTDTEETIILENVSGAAGGIDITSNADSVVYTWDKSGNQNSSYKISESRIFLFTIGSGNPPMELDTNAIPGENDLDVKYSPSEGGVIFTRVKSNFGADPAIYSFSFDQNQEDQLLFTKAFMPDWQ
ncbi:carboxypeptidase regulatory-like domain-containing protein [Aequorivita sp. SDUM287046]|uniref:Carboxypeptidase regulatory-like domain-containing protein n=1 Tax=Aequorivita aurantiaca TaxID=3053356 RepID=A0ABT8DKZ2_9FLAO|nr:carboxypeptidase regulatory-like domain-containing protein [Aequorivita aurantiaca]MDN3724626.1 carboxypeptidase regulatory-like domain-containing protein [Aequorivita aurantiaca]